MAREEIVKCDKCGQEITPKPELGERQGGPVIIQYPGHRRRMELCENCVAPLHDDYAGLGVVESVGAAPGADQLLYLPRYERLPGRKQGG